MNCHIKIAANLRMIWFFQVSVLPEGNLVQPGPALAQASQVDNGDIYGDGGEDNVEDANISPH